MIRNRNQFVHYFETEIYPKYNTQVIDEQKAKKELKKYGIKVSLIFFPLFFIGALFFGKIGAIASFGITFIFAYLLAAKNPYIGGRYTHDNPNIDWSAHIKEPIFKDIIPKVMPGFIYNGSEAITREEFINYGLISNNIADRLKSEDTITGFINDKPIRINECVIYERVQRKDSKPYYKEIYNGLLLEFELGLNPEFQMSLTLTENHRHTLSNDSNIVNIGNATLDDSYVLETNDDVKALTILQPRILEKIERLYNEGKEISISFSNSKVALMVTNNRNLFDIFKEGNFDPYILWDDIKLIVESLGLLGELDIDYHKNKQ